MPSGIRCRRSWSISPIASATARRERDRLTHPYFAGHGYACVRVDMRGSGESDGLLLDEYLKQEQDDALEVIDWIAAQPWCTRQRRHDRASPGAASTALQVAARRPPALKAVITLCSTDDRYADDIHYMGGCLLNDNLRLGLDHARAISRAPPDPALVGERWREIWLERLETRAAAGRALARHQRRDDLLEAWLGLRGLGADQCPVYAVGGWADGYSNADPAAARRPDGAPEGRSSGPGRTTIRISPCPARRSASCRSALRWWDHWLKGIETGIMDEPMIARLDAGAGPPPALLRRAARPLGGRAEWPSPIEVRTPGAERRRPAGGEAGAGGRCRDPFAQSVGEGCGAWCGFGIGPERPWISASRTAAPSASTASPCPRAWRSWVRPR